MGKVIIAGSCPFCGAKTSVEVSRREYNKWAGGELIQRAMPTLSATDRETLISGLCPACQKKMFGEG